MKRKIYKSALLLCLAGTVWQQDATAQSGKQSTATDRKIRADKRVQNFEWNKDRNTIRRMTFGSEPGYQLKEAKSVFSAYFDLRDGIDSFQLKSTTALKDGISVSRYQQYFKGLRVEHGTVAVTGKHGVIATLNNEQYKINEGLSATPVVTEQQALDRALQSVGARRYTWEDTITGRNLI